MGELVLDGVLGPTRLSAEDAAFVGVRVYGEARVGVLEAVEVRAEAEEDDSSFRLEEGAELAPAAAARVLCLEGPMMRGLADEAQSTVYAALYCALPRRCGNNMVSYSRNEVRACAEVGAVLARRPLLGCQAISCGRLVSS